MGILFVVLSNIFAIIPAQIVRHAFDLVKEGITLHNLYEGMDRQEQIYNVFARNVTLYAVIILIMALLKGVFTFYMRQTIIVMSRLVENDLKNEIYHHYVRHKPGGAVCDGGALYVFG